MGRRRILIIIVIIVIVSILFLTVSPFNLSFPIFAGKGIGDVLCDSFGYSGNMEGFIPLEGYVKDIPIQGYRGHLSSTFTVYISVNVSVSDDVRAEIWTTNGLLYNSTGRVISVKVFDVNPSFITIRVYPVSGVSGVYGSIEYRVKIVSC